MDNHLMFDGTWRELAAKVRNWGRWGPDDELGTLNHIDAGVIVDAARLVRRGAVFPLGNAFDADGPQGGSGIRRNPIHLMTLDGGDADIEIDQDRPDITANEAGIGKMMQSPLRFNDDYIMMPLQANTQWDALSHIHYEGRHYNDVPSSAVTSFGASRLGIDKVAAAGGIVSRGVLLDVARHRGVDHLEAEATIFPEELDEVAARQGVQIRTGDVVMIRTGWWLDFERRGDGESWMTQSPGLSWTCAEWLHDKNIAAVACDNVAVERLGVFDGVTMPMHMLTLRDMGLMLGEMWNFEGLGADCADDGVYEMMLVAQPIKFTGAVGSPLNPLAIK